MHSFSISKLRCLLGNLDTAPDHLKPGEVTSRFRKVDLHDGLWMRGDEDR